jgi:hypothetical protein
LAPAGTWRVIIPATRPQTDYTKPYKFPMKTNEKWKINTY